MGGTGRSSASSSAAAKSRRREPELGSLRGRLQEHTVDLGPEVGPIAADRRDTVQVRRVPREQGVRRAGQREDLGPGRRGRAGADLGRGVDIGLVPAISR
ncbi:hypothetical protein FK529_15045 [Tsukamurella asaccharolytica]|uniref:Uncharacterized protein n=1 Tax=Tsukamurella asaccharolytica TaxID=2592067 RepID=A0A5C5R983_9ACTN|nr:hypothetical protein [Tsukamurella asaccharolytica]TWS18625.1 hypothetical protein FK529_15045 [Tsukamurella asaccharolytica]